MKQFCARHDALITATLSGFDRLVLRGSLIPLMKRGGMVSFLSRAGLRVLDYPGFAHRTSEAVKRAALEDVERRRRPVRYLDSSRIDKRELARRLLLEHPLDAHGVVCALKVVEPCTSFEYHRSGQLLARGLRLVPRRCLHIYKYVQHPVFGFMSARVQTWPPFSLQVNINGREWLARQLTRRSSAFKRVENAFTWLGNPALAQRLMVDQVKTDWPRVLGEIARSMNPIHSEIFAAWPMDYYWSAHQTEWATDVLFRTPGALAGIYPALVGHATQHFQSPDVMRFLGRKAHGNYAGELVTSFKDRAEGVRVKHWARGNSVKMYDKAGSVLRVETTIARVDDFKVLRAPHDDPGGELAWRPLRKGVADLHRRAEISERSNERYLDALAVVEHPAPCARIFDGVAAPILAGGRRVRSLRIGDANDLALLRAVARGEFVTAGFRNRDLRQLLSSGAPAGSHAERSGFMASIGRRIRILRAHGLVRRIPKTHRYQITEKGRLLASALCATRETSLKRLLRNP